MKKMILILALMVTVLLQGCAANTGTTEDGKYTVVCTTFSSYDWCREILAGTENTELILLVDNGMDVHSYQPTAEDYITIAESDIFVYVGGESEKWIVKSLKENPNPARKEICLMEVLGTGIKAEEIVDGMQVDHEGHSHDEHEEPHEEPHEENHEAEYDEHIWMSLRNASACVEAISAVLEEAMPESETLLEENTKAYCAQLENLDSEYEETVRAGEQSMILVADRFPFLYLVEDYGLSYYAAFPGCQADSEASFETVVFLAEKTDENHIPALIVTENPVKGLAETVRDNTVDKNQQILTIDSMQTVTAGELETGITYLDIMRNNLEQLKTALGKKM